MNEETDPTPTDPDAPPIEEGVDPRAVDVRDDGDGADSGAAAYAVPADSPLAGGAATLAASGGPIVARPSNDYRVRRYIMIALIVGFGFYFMYDGFVGYPEKNRRVADLQQQQEQARARSDSTEEVRLGEELKALGGRKSDLDILIQKILGFGLPVLGAAYLAYTLRASRGEYRLDESGVLHVPGHPPVPLGDVTDLDRTRWDRKGIARVEYQTGGQSGTLTLDDFVYQREPTDAIFDRVVASRGGAEPRAAGEVA